MSDDVTCVTVTDVRVSGLSDDNVYDNHTTRIVKVQITTTTINPNKENFNSYSREGNRLMEIGDTTD